MEEVKMETKTETPAQELFLPIIVPNKQTCSNCRLSRKIRIKNGKIINGEKCPECGEKLINLGRVIGIKK